MKNFKTNLGFKFSLETQSIDKNSETKYVLVCSEHMNFSVNVPTSRDLIDVSSLKRVQDTINSYEFGLLSADIAKEMFAKGKDFKIQISGNIILHVDYNQYVGPEEIINFINNQ